MFLASSALRRFSRRVIPGEEENDEAGEELDRRLRATASRGFVGGGGGGSGYDPRRGGGGGFDEEEEEEGGGGGGGVPGPARRGWTYKRGDVVRTKEEQSARRREAQQRWKILCLVRTFHGADGVDEETRRERLRNRVDDWMAGFAAKLKISKDDALDAERGGEGSSATPTAAAAAMHLPERKSRDSGLGSGGGGGGGRDTASSPLLLLPSQPHYLNYLNNGNIGQANHRSNLLLPPPPPPLPRGGGGLPLLYSSLRRASELRQDSARERREFESEQRERIRARADREREKNRKERLRRRLELRSPRLMLQTGEEPELMASSSPAVRSGLLSAARSILGGGGDQDSSASNARSRKSSSRSLSPLVAGRQERKKSGEAKKSPRKSPKAKRKSSSQSPPRKTPPPPQPSQSPPPKKKESTSKRTAKISIKMRAVKKKKALMELEKKRASNREEEEDGTSGTEGDSSFLLLPPREGEEDLKRSEEGGRSKKKPSSKSSNKTKRRKRSRKRSGNRDLASSPSLDLAAAGGDGDLHSMLEDATETVVANLVYDERLGDFVDGREAKGRRGRGRTRGGLRIESSSEDDLDIEELPEEEEKGGGAKKGSASNVFRAFERARGVDELFRVAEIWVNPESYGIHQAEKS